VQDTHQLDHQIDNQRRCSPPGSEVSPVWNRAAAACRTHFHLAWPPMTQLGVQSLCQIHKGPVGEIGLFSSKETDTEQPDTRGVLLEGNLAMSESRGQSGDFCFRLRIEFTRYDWPISVTESAMACSKLYNTLQKFVPVPGLTAALHKLTFTQYSRR
jgi:hypothetical protein